MNNQLLWLDDIRDPGDTIWINLYKHHNPHEIIWVKNYNEFVKQIQINGMPDIIFFDHDLGDDVAKSRVINGMSKRQSRKLKKDTLSGYDCAKWLVDYCIDNNLLLPEFESQSYNPIGKENILSLLNNFNKLNNK